MEKEALENYRKSQSISDSVLLFAQQMVRPEIPILELAEKIESKIVNLGGKPAFPVNISINEVAAHYTPEIEDKTTLKENDLAKIDFGVQVNGYIWDRAFSVFVGKKSHPLIKASTKAVEEAIKMIKPGVRIFEISEVIEETLSSTGFKPIKNLCGHGLDRYTQHAHPSIPNGKNNIQDEIKPGKALAVEVFTTDGYGAVKESTPTLIYRFIQDRPVRLFEARKILEISKRDFEGLPFAKRWISKIATGTKLDMALRQLVETGALEEYPVLKEEGNGLVAQTEETILT